MPRAASALDWALGFARVRTLAALASPFFFAATYRCYQSKHRYVGGIRFGVEIGSMGPCTSALFVRMGDEVKMDANPGGKGSECCKPVSYTHLTLPTILLV